MAEGEEPLAPEEIADRSFPNAFRGFDPVEVRAFLGRVADELRAAYEREAELRRAVESAGDGGGSTADDAEAIVAAAKAEADRLVREAMDRVAQLSAAATAEATRVLGEARAEAARVARSKTDEVESTAVKKIADAEREAAQIRVKAREDADAIIDQAKERGREMVSEAQAARERMITDITRRKRAAAAQLDQLRGGRDRLLESLRVVRRNLDEITTRLEVVEGGASAPVAEEARQPVRGSRVMLGELPNASAARPAIDAPQARTEPPPDRAASPSADDIVAQSSAPAAPASAPVPAAEAAPAKQTEERRSSALRILRRHRPPAPVEIDRPPVGRASPGEGVRIIRPPRREPEPELRDVPEPEPEPEPVVDVETEPEPQPEREPDPEPEADLDDEIPEVADDELPPPLAREELRPKIEDLFARLRAEREQDGDKPPPSSPSPSPSARPAPQPAAVATAVDDDRDEHALQARDVVFDPLVGQLARRLKRAIQDEQNESLDRLRTARGRADVDTVLAAPDVQASPYRSAAVGFLEEAARAAAAASPFGAVAVAVDDIAAALAEDVAGAIRVRVGRVLDDAGGDDADVPALSERISAAYREWKTQKVERVAAHHLVAAWSRGTFVTTPEGTPLRWIVDDDGPCPDCDDNALAGPTPRGQAFPTGQLHPPAHPGCRCLVVAG